MDNNKISRSNYIGTTALSTTAGIAGSMMTVFFMLYLTDYAGIGTYGAILGSGVLIAVRVIGLFTDPAIGIAIDRHTPGKYGKYKPFFAVSILLITVGISFLYFIPAGIANSKIWVTIYVFIFYMIYDVGLSCQPAELLYRSISLDSSKRATLLVGPRFLNIVLGVITGMLLTMISKLDTYIGNMHTSFGIVIVCFMVLGSIISYQGWFLVKEQHEFVNKSRSKINIKDMFLLFRDNDAYRIKIISGIFSGFVWTLMFSVTNYYCKWAYCADLTTGEVDSGRYGIVILISSLLSIVPLLVGIGIAAPLMKKIGSADKFSRILLLIQAAPLAVITVLQWMGILVKLPIVFFLAMGVAAFAVGSSSIPASTINMECMDYDVYKNGRERAALANATSGIIGKLQTAISTATLGIVLTAIGYSVDSKTDTFLGDLASIPTMLNDFVIIMAVIPCVFSVIAYFLLRKYPINAQIREAMSQAE